MAKYDKINSGAMFKNDSENEKAPMYKGGVNVDGKVYDLAAWVKESAAGVKYLSISVQPPYKKETSNDDVSKDEAF